MAFDNDDFFGGIFDFDGDGQTDDAEAAIGFMIMDEWSREDEKKRRKEREHDFFHTPNDLSTDADDDDDEREDDDDPFSPF